MQTPIIARIPFSVCLMVRNICINSLTLNFKEKALEFCCKNLVPFSDDALPLCSHHATWKILLRTIKG